MQKLATKLIQVMTECSHITKNGTNSFHGYKYATSADVLEKINASLVKHGICSIAIPELISMVDVTTAKENIEKLATVKMDIMLFDKDSGETVTITGLGSGQDSGDKAVMKAETAAIKYAYMLSMAIATGDDPEADENVDKQNQKDGVKEKTKLERVNNSANKTASLNGGPTYECQECGCKITEKVYNYSVNKNNLSLCMKCQKFYQSKTA